MTFFHIMWIIPHIYLVDDVPTVVGVVFFATQLKHMSIPHYYRIHGTCIFTCIYHKHQPNLGIYIYIIYMDPIWCDNSMFETLPLDSSTITSATRIRKCLSSPHIPKFREQTCIKHLPSLKLIGHPWKIRLSPKERSFPNWFFGDMLVLGSVQTQKTMVYHFQEHWGSLKKNTHVARCSGKTLPETNSSHMKLGFPIRKFIIQASIFRATHASFREGTWWLMVVSN